VETLFFTADTIVIVVVDAQSCPIFPPPPPSLPSLLSDAADQKESLYSMLISWYTCGYYTGFYEVYYSITMQ